MEVQQDIHFFLSELFSWQKFFCDMAYHCIIFLQQERVSQTGADGQRVQDFIQSIPQTRPHLQNDFSHLGLPPPMAEDNWDNVSVSSIRTSTVPYTQVSFVMLCMLGKHFNRQHFEMLFLIFSENRLWHFVQIVS